METKTNKTSKKGKTKKTKQAKDKRNTTEAVGALQIDYQAEIRKFLLHLWTKGTGGVQLAYWPLVVKGLPWGEIEIRFEDFEAAMLQLQYKPRRNGGGLLRKNVKGNRGKGNAKITGRQAKNSEGIFPLRKVD